MNQIDDSIHMSVGDIVFPVKIGDVHPFGPPIGCCEGRWFFNGPPGSCLLIALDSKGYWVNIPLATSIDEVNRVCRVMPGGGVEIVMTIDGERSIGHFSLDPRSVDVIKVPGLFDAHPIDDDLILLVNDGGWRLRKLSDDGCVSDIPSDIESIIEESGDVDWWMPISVIDSDVFITAGFRTVRIRDGHSWPMVHFSPIETVESSSISKCMTYIIPCIKRSVKGRADVVEKTVSMEDGNSPIVVSTLLTDFKAYVLEEWLEAVGNLKWDGEVRLHISYNGKHSECERVVRDLWKGPLTTISIDASINRDNPWHSGMVALLREQTRISLLENHRDCEYILWSDCDTLIPPDAIEVLSSHHDAMISSGICPSRDASSPDGVFIISSREKDGFISFANPEDLEVGKSSLAGMTGFGCTLVRLECLEIAHWLDDELDQIVDGGSGEDGHFCIEIEASTGKKVVLDHSVITNHIASDLVGVTCEEDEETGRLRGVISEDVWVSRMLRAVEHVEDEFPNVSRTACIVTRDGSDGFEMALRSVFDQTVPVDEIVVVYDGGEPRIDSSLSLVRLVRGKGRGLASDRNVAISNSHGEQIYWIGDDEEWRHDHVERMIPHLKDPSIIVAYGDTMSVTGRLVGGAFETDHDSEFDISCWSGGYSDLCLGDLLSHSSLVIRRSAYSDVGGYDESWDIRHSEWQMMLRLMLFYGDDAIVHICDGRPHSRRMIWDVGHSFDAESVEKSFEMMVRHIGSKRLERLTSIMKNRLTPDPL